MTAPTTIRRRRRSNARVTGDLEARSIATRIGAAIRAARRRKRWTQARVAEIVGVDQSRISQIELGRSLGAPFGLLIGIGIAVGCPIAVATTRVADGGTQEAGHLAAQETVLRLGQRNRRVGTFELRSNPGPNPLFIDVGLRDDARRVLEVIEICNRLDDLGAAVRTFQRKVLEADEHATGVAGDPPYRVTGCWVLRATAANRALVASYPATFDAAFPGSSRAWVRALVDGTTPPEQPGVVWIDLAGTRIWEVRLRTPAGGMP